MAVLESIGFNDCGHGVFFAPLNAGNGDGLIKLSAGITKPAARASKSELVSSACDCKLLKTAISRFVLEILPAVGRDDPHNQQQNRDPHETVHIHQRQGWNSLSAGKQERCRLGRLVRSLGGQLNLVQLQNQMRTLFFYTFINSALFEIFIS